MSVRTNRLGGYDVRYRDATGKHRSKTFRRRRDAERFDQQIKDAKQTGTLARLDAGQATLDAMSKTPGRPSTPPRSPPAPRALHRPVRRPPVRRPRQLPAARTDARGDRPVAVRPARRRRPRPTDPQGAHPARQHPATRRRGRAHPGQPATAGAATPRPPRPRSTAAGPGHRRGHQGRPDARASDAGLAAGLRRPAAAGGPVARAGATSTNAPSSSTPPRPAATAPNPAASGCSHRCAQTCSNGGSRPGAPATAPRVPRAATAASGAKPATTTGAKHLGQGARNRRRPLPAALRPAPLFASLLLHEGRSVIYVARQLGHGAAAHHEHLRPRHRRARRRAPHPRRARNRPRPPRQRCTDKVRTARPVTPANPHRKRDYPARGR